MDEDTATHPQSAAALPRPWTVFLAYLGFVIYGSTVPLDFVARSATDALRSFAGAMLNGDTTWSWTDSVTNVALYIPLALLGVAVLAGRGRRWGAATVALVVVACTAVSTGIEFMQEFIASRTPLRADILNNLLGALLGAAIWPWMQPRFDALRSGAARFLRANCTQPPHDRRWLWSLGPTYLVALAWASGWWTTAWMSPAAAWQRLPDLYLLPFYVHYFADIGVALSGVVKVTLAYLPLGLIVWATRRPTNSGRALLGSSVTWAIAIATLLEGGRLFITDRQPDFGNPLFAALGAALGAYLACTHRQHTSRRVPAAPQTTAATAIVTAHPGWRLMALPALVVAAAALWRFPVLSVELTLLAIAYLVLLVRVPQAWLVALPALLPVLDLAPWSGRHLFDAFDILLTLTLAAGYAFGPEPQLRSAMPTKGFGVLVSLFAASTLASLAMVLAPNLPLGSPGAASVQPSFDALSVAKGSLWALTLLPLLAGLRRAGVAVRRVFAWGMVAGLGTATASILWERAIFPGLFDVSRDFRAAGFMSSMHNGGAHIEAFLAMTMPFLAVGIVGARSRSARFALLLLFPLAIYAMAVTYSRGGYAALLLALGIVLVGIVSTRSTAGTRRAWPTIVVAGVAAAAVTLPIVSGDFAQSRLQRIVDDARTRAAHWTAALAMRKPDPITALFGMGVGSYPTHYFYRQDPARRPASFAIVRDAATPRLALGAGTTGYLQQRVAAARGDDYTLQVVARSRSGKASINVLLCERTYFDAFGCSSATFTLGETWSDHQQGLKIDWPGTPARPVTLSLENASRDGVAEVARVALLSADGRNLVRNGNFTGGADHWFFSSDDHLAWHVKNLWVALLFDQGWAGVVTFTLLVGYAIVILLGKLRHSGDLAALAALASVLAFLTVGVVGSLFDAPRLALLFLLTVFVGVAHKDTRPAPPPAMPQTTHVRRNSSTRAAAVTASPLLSVQRLDRHRLMVGAVPGFVLLSLSMIALPHMTAVPYNVRELVATGSPLLSAALLTLFGFWLAGVPVWMAWRLGSGQRFALSLLPALLAHGLVAAAVIALAVPDESLHDLVGSPVLGWPPAIETVLRLGVLFAALSSLLTGGALLARVVSRQAVQRTAAVAWLGSVLPVLVLAHLVSVTFASTDNLTELMTGGGSLVSSTALSGAVLFVSAGASLVAFTAATRVAWSRTLAWTLVMMILAAVLAGVGFEQHIIKYGEHYSALQFLLSSDRAHVVSGTALAVRMAVAGMSVVLGVALLQYPFVRATTGAHDTDAGTHAAA